MDVDVQGYIRAALWRGRDHERIGQFVAAFDLHSTTPSRNYAVPDDGAEPSAEEVTLLVAAFRRRGRMPRLEYIPGQSPAVEPALVAAGFGVERREPVLACAPGDAVGVAPPRGFVVAEAASDGDLLDTATVQYEAYAEPAPPQSHDVDRLRATRDRGGLVALAREEATGAPVGTGLVTDPVDGVSELAAVGVRAAYRRLGIATAVGSFLARTAGARSVTALWLEAEGPSEQRIYARVGFAVVGEKLSISLS